MMIYSKYGIVTNCQVCNNKIWINTSWDGITKWRVPGVGETSSSFRCPWCHSLLNMYMNNDNILRFHILERNNTLKKIDFKYPLIVDESSLVDIIESVIKTFVTSKGIGINKDKISIEAHFSNVDDLKKEIARRIVSILRDNKSLPIPVFDR